jgi:hypothetical protein
MKICSKCNQEKSLDDFYRANWKKDGYKSTCKLCSHAMTKEWRQKHPEYRRRQLYQEHGITEAIYLTMLVLQDSRCSICKRTPERPLCIDHDHKCCPGNYSCGKCIRGLLCNICNQFLGIVDDDLTQASRYVCEVPQQWATQDTVPS